MFAGPGGTIALAQTTAERATRSGQGTVSDVRDPAGLFSADAIASARRALERIERETGVAVLIETIDSLNGESPAEAAVGLARRSGLEGVFVLIARKERKLEVLASRAHRELLTDARRQAIRGAFLDGFRRQDFNDGLARGVAALGEALAGARPGGRTPLEALAAGRRGDVPDTGPAPATSTSAHSGPAADSPLIVRNQVRLALAGARAVLGGAEARAQAMGLKVNIAVVDDGGHLLAFERMDGARPASGYTALTKATTAATIRQPSGPLPPGTTSPDPLLNLSLQNAALASGGKITTLYGGVPVVVDGQVIGGVGVGGGTGEQDAQIARAGIQVFLDQLAAPRAAAGDRGRADDPSRSGRGDGPTRKGDDSSF
jgi:glc operon protein GlcG